MQPSLLTALLDHGEMDQNTLAIEIGLERTSVAEVLPRLEAREVIERRQSPHDKRVKLVKLSRKGRSLLKRMEPAALRAHAPSGICLSRPTASDGGPSISVALVPGPEGSAAAHRRPKTRRCRRRSRVSATSGRPRSGRRA